LAIQMYLADNNDTFPAQEHRPEVIEYFDTMPGGASEFSGNAWNTGHCGILRDANPYLRGPVVLEEYTKNRDVWRCPSAKMETGAGFIYPVSDYFQYLVDNEGQWGETSPYGHFGPCAQAFPKGWGGEVTDSLAQGRYAVVSGGMGGSGESANKAFVQSLGYYEGLAEMKLVEFEDTVNAMVIFEAGPWPASTGIGLAAYPDLCVLECGNSLCGWSGGADGWDVMADDSCCGDDAYMYAPFNGAFLANPTLRKPYARHLGGVNMGFMDGHAAWISSEALVRKAADGDITNVDAWGPNTACYWGNWADDYPGVPTLF